MKAKRSLGQNFLTNDDIAKRIVESAQVTGEDTVFEIGPGKGVLTKHLLAKVWKVIAVEKDDALYAKLCTCFAKEIDENRLELIHDDIKNYSLSTTN